MRGNGWQVTGIVSIILCIVLIVPIIIMGRGWQEMNDRMKKAEDSQKETAAKAAKLEGDVKILTGLIGKEGLSTEEVRKVHDERMTAVLPNENATTQTYDSAVLLLVSDLQKERDAHGKTQDMHTQLSSDYKNLESLYTSIVEQASNKLAETEEARKKASEKYSSNLQESKNKMEDMTRIHTFRLAEATNKQNEAEKDNDRLVKEREDIQKTNETLAETIGAIRNPNVEYPAGKILSVDQESGLVVMNLGSADGLMVRTMFSVYNSQVTGLSFASTITGKKDPQYCDVCKRELSLSTSKGSIEVMRILGSHRAECRILDDVLTDPIAVSDVVYSPIWRPGQVQGFALTSNMGLPGVDKESGYKMLIELIRANGGTIDCWIDETDNPELKADERIKGAVNQLTSYVVVNEDPSKDLDPEINLAESKILDQAKQKAVRKISLQDLLYRMGWKNVTPEYRFGSSTYLKEMRTKPVEPTQSYGSVSERFKPDNSKARVSANDIKHRDSVGSVSDFYGGKAPAIKPSSGKVTDLFKNPKPVEIDR